MPIPTKLPEWATGGSADIVEPSAGRKALGWEKDDEPPAGWWNWWNNIVYQWIKSLSDIQVRNWRHANSFDVGNDSIYDVCYGLGYWIIVGNNSGETLQTSLDGYNWVAQTSPFVDTLFAVYANDTHAVAVGASGKLAYSTNPGLSWTENSIAVEDNLVDVWYGNGYWVAFDSAGYAYTATDPTGTWTQRTTPVSGLTAPISRVRYIEEIGIWVAVGERKTAPSYSGIMTAVDPCGTWAERVNPISGDCRLRGITFNGSYVIAVGGDENDYQNCIISADGILWTDKSSNLPGNDQATTCAADLFGHVIIRSGPPGDLFYLSNDNCDSWEAIEKDGPGGGASGFYAADCGNGRFMFVGYDDVIRSLAL